MKFGKILLIAILKQSSPEAKIPTSELKDPTPDFQNRVWDFFIDQSPGYSVRYSLKYAQQPKVFFDRESPPSREIHLLFP